jgi:RNA polymerase sigma-70 factor, ECF subfamily
MTACMNEEDASDGELLKRMVGGDREAFAALYRRRQAGVHRFALQMSGSEALADDVVQEVFLTLMRVGGGYDPACGQVTAFLYGIARNHVRRGIGRVRTGNAESTPELVAADHPESDLARRETIASVRAAVLALPVRYREVVVLCELEEMDCREAADALGCAVGTVKSRLHRARRMLAARLLPARATADISRAVRPARCLP